MQIEIIANGTEMSKKLHNIFSHPLSNLSQYICPECKERLIAKAAALAEDVKRIESSASSKENLILAAEAAAKTGRELAEEMKATSASLGSDLQEAQASKSGRRLCERYIAGVPARFN